MKKRSTRWRGSREIAPAAAATATRGWERVRALGEGGEGAERRLGSVQWNSLARDVALPMAAARTELAFATPFGILVLLTSLSSPLFMY